MNILFIGDIVGNPGRRAVEELLPRLVDQHFIDLVVANGENASGGIGITPPVADQLLSYGIDLLTSGNHIWKHKEIRAYLQDTDRLLRPANYPPESPGRGYAIVETAAGEKAAVINLEGRVFMEPLDCPFRTVDAILKELPKEIKIILVDIHAEATSEKQALGWFLDGRVSAVLGTPYPRPDRRRPDSAQWHRLPQRRRHDRPGGLGYRHAPGDHPGALLEPVAAAFQSGHPEYSAPGSVTEYRCQRPLLGD
jgi:metallophosphoesterase (TIGR00282 family)